MDTRSSIRRIAATGGALFLALTGFGTPSASAQMAPEPLTTEADAAFFPVGERLEYGIALGRLRLGHATLCVEAVDTVDGVLTYRTSLHVEVGGPLLDFDDRLVSWIEPRPFRSRAFARNDSGGGDRVREYRFDPETRRAAVEQRTSDGRVVAELAPLEDIPVDVLDELAALYLLRSLSLKEGETRVIDRYFDTATAPMKVTARATVRLRVPAGRFTAVEYGTVMPALPAFGPENDASIFVSDDDEHLIVQVETDMKFGRLRMYLTDYEILDESRRSP